MGNNCRSCQQDTRGQLLEIKERVEERDSREFIQEIESRNKGIKSQSLQRSRNRSQSSHTLFKNKPTNRYYTQYRYRFKMQVQHTPPKRRVEFNFSTPPKDHSDQSTLVVKSNLKSSRKSNNRSIKSFSPTKTPYKSLKKSSVDSDDDQSGRLDTDFVFQRMLGKGNFSRVSLYKSKISGEMFAIKEITLSRMSQNQLQALATISVFCENSENLVRYFNSWTEDSSCFITMEYCDKALEEEFEEHRDREIQIPEHSLVSWLKQALNGLCYLHQKNIVHLDIKPENILFNKNQLKISDLGLCRLGRVNKWMELVEGDSRYLDKIILNYNENTDLTKADIFSLGLTFYEAITLDDMPTNGPEWHKLREGNVFDGKAGLDNYSKAFLNIIEQMVLPNPLQRPTARQLLNELNSNQTLERSIKKSRITEHDPSNIPMMVEQLPNEQPDDMLEPFQLLRRISRTPMISAHKEKQRLRENSL